MNKYRVTWIGTNVGEVITSDSPWEAWKIFYKRHPNFKDEDDEGPSYYVTIEDMDGTPLLEAGKLLNGNPYVCVHPDNPSKGLV